MSKFLRVMEYMLTNKSLDLNNLEQPFIGNDETNAHQKSDIQQQRTSYKWVPMQDSTMCWELKPVTCNRKLSDTGKRWCKQCDEIHILLKRSWVDLEIRSSTVMIRSIYLYDLMRFKNAFILCLCSLVMKPPHAGIAYKIRAIMRE